MSVFVDTSAFYATYDEDDFNHKSARAIWTKAAREQWDLFTHNYVIVETVALLQNRLGAHFARRFHEDAVPLLRVQWLNAEDHMIALATWREASRRKLSLVDCASFHVMRTCTAEWAFAFDKHFKEQGFCLVTK